MTPGTIDPDVQEVIRCPACHGRLAASDDRLRCVECAQTYGIEEGGIRVLFQARSECAQLLESGRPLPALPPPRRFSLSSLPMTRFLDDRFFHHINGCNPDMRILNLGSGVGLFDGAFRSDLRFVNLDVWRNERTHILADGHYLPFADGSFDAVVSNAVLEHVRKPWIIADELWRILKPGGRIFIKLPFLNVIHDERDYNRYTDRGLEALFDRFEKIDCRVSAGPGSFFGPFLVEYLICFVPGRVLGRLARGAFTLLAWP